MITPTSNLKVAFLLYGTIALFLILILIVGLMFVMAAPDDKVAQPAAPKKRQVAPKQRRAARPMSARMLLWLGVGIAVALLGVWVAAGYTTSDTGFCKSCHSLPHTRRPARAPTHTRESTACPVTNPEESSAAT